MFPAEASFRQLTKAQLLVLATLQNRQLSEGGAILASSRQLAGATGLSRRTVQAAIHRLNALHCLVTRLGDATHTSSHAVLPGVLPGRGKVPAANNCATPEIAPPRPHTLPQPLAQLGNCATPVQNSRAYPQKATSAYKERAPTVTSTATDLDLEATRLSESASAVRVREETLWETERPVAPPALEDETEVTVFVEVLLSNLQLPSPDNQALLVSPREALDPQTRADFNALPAQFRITPGTLCRFLGEKFQQKQKKRRTIFHAGALYSFCAQDLPAWIAANGVTVAADRRALLPARKPPVSAPGTAVGHPWAAQA